jgi:hypothetical protein
MLTLIYFGKTFDVIKPAIDVCSMSGLGKRVSFLILIGNRSVEFGRCCRCYAGGLLRFISWVTLQMFPSTQNHWQLAKLGIDAPYGKLLPMRSLAIKYFNHLRIFWYCLLEGWLVWLPVRMGLGTSFNAISDWVLVIPLKGLVVAFFVGLILLYSQFKSMKVLKYLLVVLSSESYWQNRKQFLVMNLWNVSVSIFHMYGIIMVAIGTMIKPDLQKKKK